MTLNQQKLVAEAGLLDGFCSERASSATSPAAPGPELLAEVLAAGDGDGGAGRLAFMVGEHLPVATPPQPRREAPKDHPAEEPQPQSPERNNRATTRRWSFQKPGRA